jgi:hypothetical protein
VRAIETIRQALSLAVRVDDHFTGAPWPQPVTVGLDSKEPPVRTADGSSARHADGTYRFIAVRPGVRTVTVTPGGDAFTWTPSTTVDLATHDRSQALVVEVWPGPSATVAAGTLVMRGQVTGAVMPGLEVRIEVVGAPPRSRRTRVGANGEFVFPVLGTVDLTVDQRVELDVTVPTRTVASIQIIDHDTNPVTVGHRVKVLPGRATRARLTLS